jgi:MarR family transcriptional regulator, transcriptional regulator for hemolysin
VNLPTYIFSTTQVKAQRLLREHVYAVLSQYDLTPTYWSMLGIIMQAQDGLRQVEIARAMHVKAPLVTAMARQLQDKGLIQSVQNQFDARAKLLAITPSGKKSIKTVEAELHAELEKLLNGLTENDVLAYHNVLKAIIANDALIKKQG